MLRSGSLALSLSQIFHKWRPKVLQAATCYDASIPLFLKRRVRIPFIIYAHGNEILEAAKDCWDIPRQALREASCVLACSRFTASLVADIGVSPQRIIRLNPGCDPDRFRPQQITDRGLTRVNSSGPVILTVGNLVQRKGQDMVIHAVYRLRKELPDLQYVIVGDGPYRSTLEQLAAGLGLQSQIVFAGRVDDKTLPEYYAAADVVIMASRQRLDASDVEGFGITFLEAAACAKPVIAGRSGGSSDAVIDGKTGLLVDPENPADIADALSQLLRDPLRVTRMGEQARKRVLTEFTWKHVAGRVANVIEQVGAG
jgi:phosphatidylinositol alpha-1,6-mannosyltransferase